MSNQPSTDFPSLREAADVRWQRIDTAPKDGRLILGCINGRWRYDYEQWMAPQAIAWRGFHPNAPGKACWRDKDGKPLACTHWRPLPKSPTAEARAEKTRRKPCPKT